MWLDHAGWSPRRLSRDAKVAYPPPPTLIGRLEIITTSIGTSCSFGCRDSHGASRCSRSMCATHARAQRTSDERGVTPRGYVDIDDPSSRPTNGGAPYGPAK